MTGLSRNPIAYVAVMLVLCSLSGCEQPAPGSASGAFLHEVVPVGKPYVALRLYGLIVNHEPDGYQPPAPYLPVEELVPEGSTVEAGDPLFGLSTAVAERWWTEGNLNINAAETQATLDRLKADQGIEQLNVQRRDLEQQDRVLAARIAATRVKDKAELAIAELQLQHAQRSLAGSKRRLERLQRLAQRDAVSGRALRRAEDDLVRARQAVRVPSGDVDFWRNVSGAAARRLLQIERASMGLELGSPEHIEGIFRSISALRSKQQLQELIASSRLRNLQRYHDRDQRLMAENMVIAREAGVVRYREGGLRLGERLRSNSAMFVLRDQDMGFTFELPVRWRNLLTAAIPDEPDSGRVYVDVPQMGLHRLPGQVRSIAASPYRTPKGRAYRCTVMLAKPLKGLREGMQVDCTFRVPVPADALEVPIWAVRDPADPWVIMADGTRRSVSGRFIGGRFVIFEGLSVGEKIRAQIEDTQEQPIRLSGLVHPVQSVDLDVPWSVEIVDMLPDGSYVEQGAVVATVVKTRRDQMENKVSEAQEVRDRADVSLAVARIEGEAELTSSYVAWQQATLAVDEARLLSMISRYGGSGDDPTAADVAHRLAQLAFKVAEQRLRQVQDPAAADTVSAQQVRAAQLDRDRARLAAAKAQLGAVAILRQRDWMAVWQSEAEVYAAQQHAATLRDQYSQQRESFNLDLARADDAHQVQVDRAMRILRRHDRLTVRAPFSGRVYHHFDDRGRQNTGRPLKTGRRLRTTRPFYMPTDLRREVSIEVPVRFHGRFEVGSQVPLHVSIFGSQPLIGTVTAISRHFHVSELAADEHLLRGSAGVPPKAFTLSIALPLDDQQADRVRPGVTAVMELKP